MYVRFLDMIGPVIELRADGTLGGYAWGVERKVRLLRDEQLKTP